MAIQKYEYSKVDDAEHIVVEIFNDFKINFANGREFSKFENELLRNIKMFLQSKEYSQTKNVNHEGSIVAVIDAAVKFLRSHEKTFVHNGVFNKKTFKAESIDNSTLQNYLANCVSRVRQVPMDYDNPEMRKQVQQQVKFAVANVANTTEQIKDIKSSYALLAEKLIGQAQAKEDLAIALVNAAQAQQVERTSSLQLNNMAQLTRGTLFPLRNNIYSPLEMTYPALGYSPKGAY